MIPGGVKNGIVNLAIKDQENLYSVYMPFVENGGVFLATNKKYKLGDEIFILLDLMEEAERLPVTGKVIWLSPQGMGTGVTEGVGIQFNEKHADIQGKFENYLAGMMNMDKTTFTM